MLVYVSPDRMRAIVRHNQNMNRNAIYVKWHFPQADGGPDYPFEYFSGVPIKYVKKTKMVHLHTDLSNDDNVEFGAFEIVVPSSCIVEEI